MIPRLSERYKKEIIPAMQEKFHMDNAMAVIRLEKIVVNMGVGEAIDDPKILEKAAEELAMITGQKPIIRRAKLAISNFKLKAGQAVGCKVTLRQAKMYEFMDRLINVALPRIRDFNGVSRRAFDREGNYTLGLNEQTIFPEVELDRISKAQGMDITFVFNHGPKEQTLELLSLFGMPFAKS
ncbi:MAG: 50S ribosomal protein L5 [Candidatus Omnitrophota bacterium]